MQIAWPSPFIFVKEESIMMKTQYTQRHIGTDYEVRLSMDPGADHERIIEILHDLIDFVLEVDAKEEETNVQ